MPFSSDDHGLLREFYISKYYVLEVGKQILVRGLCLKRLDDCLAFGFAVLVTESLNEMGNLLCIIYYAYNRAQQSKYQSKYFTEFE